MANSGYGDACPNCGCTFWGDDYNGSDRSEFTCPCGDLTCCQSCSDDAEQCAQCNQVLCECDGGHDLAGERYCSQHLQPSTTFQQVAGRRHQYREDDEMRVQELRTIRGQQNSTAILAGMLDLAVPPSTKEVF